MAAAVLVSLCLVTAGLAQEGINATLYGTVSDPSGALIPGVEVTAKNTGTGVTSTTITNESGTYRFPSLQPGPYDVTSTLTGFQTQTFRLSLGTAQNIRQNFALQVGGAAQTVEVTVAADALLTASAASVGTVLGGNQLVDLPLVGRNVIDLATTLPGVVGNGTASTTFGGITANATGNVGMSIDGVTMNTQRYTQGLTTSFFINPDLVEEMRVVVAPVDVEGRGAAQIQMRARSGTNQFRGAATWNIRNSALNANTWDNNRLRVSPIWYNRHQTTASVGGPIIKNKTFFFALYDRQDQLQKQSTDSVVLTPTARQGIFRFFPGVNNGNADVVANGTGATRTVPVVDKLGNPLSQDQMAKAGATGPLTTFNVFGDTLNPGDPVRKGPDPTGYIAKIMNAMPLPNAYDGATAIGGVSVDGLNTGVIRFVRRNVGGNAGGNGGVIDAYNRNQINIKIDHNFSQKHRLSGSWVRESHYTDNNDLSPWPNGYNGEIREEPRVRTLTFTSTLTPTLLNEFRYGDRLNELHWNPAIETPGVKEKALQFMPTINGYPVYVRPTLFANHVIGSQGDLGHTSPLTTYTDTLSWSHGAHAFKGGVEFRYGYTAGYQPAPVTAPNLGLIPVVVGGAGNVAVSGISSVSNLLTNNVTLAQNLLLFLTGSVGQVTQRFETWEPTDTQFLDFKTSYNHAGQPENTRGKIRKVHQNEFNWFFKDDWKLRPNFTLNLGVRWDLFRVPYVQSGTDHFWTRGPVDGNAGFFGISGRTFAEAFHNGGQAKAGPTAISLIGTNSKYPNLGIWPSDRNNFAPAIGFAWSPGFGGKDKTTVRGGYQIAYLLPGNSLSWVDLDNRTLPGNEYAASDSGGSTFRDLSSLILPLASPASIAEQVIQPLTDHSTAQNFFAPNYVSPYVQTFTLAVTRQLPGSLILDMKYLGTRGVKLHSSINFNEPDFQYNGLLQALTITRAGGDAAMFDQMFKGLNFGAGIGVVGTNVTGSEALRRNTQFRADIANGNFRNVANTLNTANIGVAIPAGQTLAGRTLASSGLFTENFITANPQFGALEMRDNSDSSNYHSLQTQLTMRPKHGITYQASWTWSRATGTAPATGDGGGTIETYRDFMNRHADYTVASFQRTHDFRGYATIELPFGPGRLIGSGTHGALGSAIGGWQLGTIFDLSTGAPLNVSATTTINRSGTPDIVGNFPRSGNVSWPNPFGTYFSQTLYRVTDPSCAKVADNLKQFCSNSAISTDAAGQNLILQNAAPGQLGTLGLSPIYGPGNWNVDANLQKKIRLAESRSLAIRLDARNIFNHPTPGNPNLNINTGTFGQITTKTGNRTLAGQLRLEF
jgi:Carboxypeptidase regulatory-like domain